MQSIKTPIYQTQQIREIERLAEERFSIASYLLMQRAGKAAFDYLQRRWPQAKKIAVFCGSGNNGGDGYVLAAQAHERGLDVIIWQVGNHDKIKGDAQQAYLTCKQNNIPIRAFDEKANLEHPDVIVDAICGIGVHDTLHDEAAAAIKKIQRVHIPILAIDIPTGIDADTGKTLGAAIQAHATITFIGLKLGLLTSSGVSSTGELILNDLQLPTELFSYVVPVAEKIHASSYTHFLKPRSRDWHKGLSGHVLVIGGDKGYSGAPRMAAEAALRVGAGLVSVATHKDNAVTMNIACPEIMCHGITNPHELDFLFEKADVIILGPGMGQSEWAKSLYQYACQQSLVLVVDADGLNFLAQTDQYNENWILTPHPGEAARLLGTTSALVQQDRLTTIKEVNSRYGGVCVLKGAGSLVLAPNSLPALCDKGNPGMASAGMGDILSGVIGGLLAQGIPLGEAAKLGVCLHGMAGDMAAKEGERGMIAMDLMPYLRRLSNPSAVQS
jgi:hydroxyethylthiazole kinase-like uncharacterized protein yjeF